MRLCVVSFKQCWQDAAGGWYSYGGFPAQMAALRRICDQLTIVIVDSHSRAGGIPLPPDAEVVALKSPAGIDFRRKLSVAAHLPYYLRRIARETRRADLVHTPIPGDLPFIGLALAVMQRRPLFALYNGSWTANSETTVMNRVTRQTMRALARVRTVMLAVGDGAEPPARGMHWLFATSLTEAELAANPVHDERGLSDPPRLIYAGRLSVEKGVRVLLQALAIMKQSGRGPMPMVTLAGDGPQRTELESLAHELGCADAVHFAGQLDRTALNRALRTADLCVHPSHTEGYCKAWLDAMAQGLPVLSTRVGAAEDVIGRAEERGWLVPPNSPAELAAAMTRILTDPTDWPSLRRRCRAFAEARTLEVWADDIRRRCVACWPALWPEGNAT